MYMQLPAAATRTICQILLLCLLLVLTPGDIYAQLQTDGNPFTNNIASYPTRLTPGGYFDTVFDRFGNKFLLGQISTNDAIRNRFNASTPGTPASTPPATHLYTTAACPSNYFNIYLEDGCGMDQYAISPTHQARLNVMVQVLCDLSNFIKSPCATTGQKVNIWVRGGLTTGLGVASPFFNLPYAPGFSGITDNTAWLTINSGKDAFTNISPPVITSGGGTTGSGPGITYFHGSIAFNFSAGIIWNTDAIPATAPAANVSDLYTVILHEMLHTLGFCSVIDYTGKSVFDDNLPAAAPPVWQYYSRYDQHLVTSTSSAATVPLLSGTLSGCGMYQYSFNPAAAAVPTSILSPEPVSLCPDGFNSGGETSNTVCSLAIRFAGTSDTIPVYTPACFERGASLSHFDDQCYVPAGFPLSPPASNEQYFVMSNATPDATLGGYNATTNPGLLKRFPTNEERMALCAIGYAVDTAFGVPGPLSGSAATTYAGLSGPNLNHHGYGGSACPGRQVAGFNDGISSSGTYAFFTTSGTPIDINAGPSGSSILDNDKINGVSLVSSGGSFSCLQVMTGTGTISRGSTVYPTISGTAATPVTYTPGATDFGVQLLRYVPMNSSSEEGNITYVYVFVGAAGCTPSACDLVSNGGFEDPASGASGPNLGSGAEKCWLTYCEDPELMAFDGSSPFNIPNTYWYNGTSVHPYSTGINQHFLWLDCGKYDTATWWTSSIQEQLTTPLINGSKYAISFWAILQQGGTAGYSTAEPTHLIFNAGNPFPLVGTFYTPRASTYVPAGYQPIKEFLITQPDSLWHFYTDTFTYTGSGSLTTAGAVMIQAAPWDDDTTVYPPTGGWASPITVDDISIVPADITSTFSIPGPICLGSAPTDLNYTASISIPGGTFTWSTVPVTAGVATVSHSSIFSPIDAYNASVATGGIGIVQVAYTYTVAGCVRTAFAEVQVAPGPAVTGVGVLCPGASVTLSDSLAGGAWSSGNTGVATVDPATGVVTGASAGTAVITYATGTGCIASMTVTVNPCTTGISSLNNSNKINVFPNPVHEELTIEGAGNTTVRVLNVTGECVQSANLPTGKNTINVKALATGVYFIEITAADGTKNRVKVLKN